MAFGLFLVYLACSFIRPFELAPELAQYNPMMFLGMAALLAGLVARLQVQSDILRSRQLWLVTVFIAWAMLSVIVAERWLGGALDLFARLSSSIFVFYLIALSVDRLSRFRTTLRMLVVLALVIATEGILAYHTGYRAEELILEQGLEAGSSDLLGWGTWAGSATVPRIRSRGFLNDPNDLAQALIAILPFVFAARPRATWGKVAMWVPAALMLYAVVLTRSRGGLLSLLVLVFLILRDRLPSVVALAASGTGTLGLLALGVLGGRATGMDESTGSRTDAWRSGWEMLKASPLWGVGCGFFTDHHERVAHNSFVQCFAELGLVGYLVWLAIIFGVIRSAGVLSNAAPGNAGEEEIRRYSRACLHSLAAFLVAAFFLSRTYSTLLFLLLGLVLALEQVAARRRMSTWGAPVLRWLASSVAILVASIVFVYVVIRVVP